MKFAPVPLSNAKEKILGHNKADANGRRLLQAISERGIPRAVKEDESFLT